MSKIEIPIGQKFYYGETLLTISKSKDHTCTNCFFYNAIKGCNKKESYLKCCKEDRIDKNDIIYEEIKK